MFPLNTAARIAKPVVNPNLKLIPSLLFFDDVPSYNGHPFRFHWNHRRLAFVLYRRKLLSFAEHVKRRNPDDPTFPKDLRLFRTPTPTHLSPSSPLSSLLPPLTPHDHLTVT